MSPISVVIVNFNTRDLLRECLSSLGGAFEVIVVDNASRDGSADMVEREFPHVRLLKNAQNRGFGPANNQGLEAAQSRLVLLLNSDARPEPGAVERLAEAFDDPTVVAAGGMLLTPDGALQPSCCSSLTLWRLACEQLGLEKAFKGSNWFDSYWLSHRLVARDPRAVHDVDQVMGACLMMRPVERFDERFPLYCEDTDLCHRLRRLGRIVYVPEARFVHRLGASSLTDRWRSISLYNRGKELYFALHHGRRAWLSALLLDRFGALVRLTAWSVATAATLGLAPRPRRLTGTFFRVLGAPIQGPPLAG